MQNSIKCFGETFKLIRHHHVHRIGHVQRPRKQPTAASSPGKRPIGPEPPPSRGRTSKPNWLRILEEDAAVDEDVAELLDGAGGDPEVVRSRMEARLRGGPGSHSGGPTGSSALFQARTGSDDPPRVSFRDMDVLDTWVWLELAAPPTERERELLASAIRSWFVVGKLGGYNSSNLQVYYNTSDDISYLDYDGSALRDGFRSLMHDVGELEVRGNWARFHVDMGTADEIGFDVLINMLTGFSAEVLGITRLQFGGEHESWSLPDDDEEREDDSEDGDDDSSSSSRPRRRERGQAPKVGMNPMRLPQGLEEELELMDQLGAIYGAERMQGEAGLSKRGGLRPSSASEAPITQPGTKGAPPPPTTQRRRQQQQQQQPTGMSMYSPEEFRRAFNVSEQRGNGSKEHDSDARR